MDLERMLEMCKRDQWSIHDLDWSVPPKDFSPSDEQGIVQYFTDMAGIELMAGELFRVQHQQARDPVLREIFATFVKDEIRHSQVADRLAAHYNVHHYRDYRRNPHLVRFAHHFVTAIHHLSAEIANAYITTGELLLDVALLRSINDFVDDGMSHEAMKLINRDESRHIAVDYHMVEYYSSDEYQTWLATQPTKSASEQLVAWKALMLFMFHARPFFRDVFFAPMDLVDPSGKRLIEAFKRVQLLSSKPSVAARPFPKFMNTMRELFVHPVAGPVFGGTIERIMGVDGRVIRKLSTDEEERRAMQMSFDQLAQEALAAKTVN
jgi:hypothetical protein